MTTFYFPSFMNIVSVLETGDTIITLARKTNLSYSHTHMIVYSLKERGFILITPNKKDVRKSNVQLSQIGIQLQTNILILKSLIKTSEG